VSINALAAPRGARSAPMRRFTLVLAFILAVLPPAQAARAQPAPQLADPRMSDASMIEDFVVIALGREYSEDQAREGRLIRWRRPIRVSGMGPRVNEWADTLAWHMRRLSRITGHPIELRRGGEVDMLAIFVEHLTADAVAAHGEIYRRMFPDQERYDAQMARIRAGSLNAVCFSNVRVDNDFAISAAIAFIPLDRGPRVVRQCIIEELAQSMGLPNDSDDVDPSIFNDRSPYIELTAKDILMLRMLYHPAMRLGMTAPDIRRVGPRVLADLRLRPYRD
jgi:hypothetical protein